ncbi:MAG TPA: alpha/beta hydrolase [Acidimicrobiales bacterium]|nr:alpha/beta hydrolase [Acidimicrobiales bacterium]
MLGIHGITASCLSLAPVARHLGHGLAAPDLRGRGDSAGLGPPYGIDQHAADCAQVIRRLATGPVVVVGESMGAFVAVVLAARFPELVTSLVLVDGGLPAPTPLAIESDAALDALLGPALARLRQTFDSPEAYRAFWQAHPAFAGCWSDDVVAYVDFDLVAVAGGWRSKCSEAAVRADGAAMLADPGALAASLESVAVPVTLLRATRNLMDQPPPLIPDSLVDQWRQRVPQLVDLVVPDTNHYSIMFGEPGVSAIAAAARQ